MTTHPPRSRAPRTPVVPALGLIALAQLVVYLDGSIVTIALPHIGADLGMDGAGLTWLMTGYVLPFGALLLLGGRLGDAFGHRRLLVVGALGFAAASCLGGAADRESLLIASRALQGASSALMAPAILALVTTTFAPGVVRDRAFAVYAAASGAGAGTGLLLGGWLTGLDSVVGLPGWRFTFLLNVPLALTVVLLAPRLLRESEPRPVGLDVTGAVTAGLGLSAVVFGATRAGEGRHGWADPTTAVSLAVGVLLLVVFVVVERTVAHPLLPLRVVTDRRRAAAFLALAVAMAAQIAMFFFLTRVVQEVLGYSPLETGLAFVPLALGVVVGAALTARLVARVGTRVVTGTGLLLMAAALLLLARIPVDDGIGAVVATVGGASAVGAPVDYAIHLLPGLVAMAVGTGMFLAGVAPASLAGVDEADTGVASGLFNATQQIGGALGIALASTVSLRAATAREAEVSDRLAAALGERGETLERAVHLATFTAGVSQAFLLGAAAVVAASVLAWSCLRVARG